MNLKTFVGGLCLTLSLCVGRCYADSPAEFLDSCVDARTHSLGNSFAADLGGNSSFGRNPAAMGASTGSAVSATVGLRPEDLRIFQVSWRKAIGRRSLGVHVSNLRYPAQMVFDESGKDFGEFKNQDLAMTFAAGGALGRQRWGLSGTWVRKEVAGFSGQGLSLSGAVILPLHRRFSLGLSALNLTAMPFRFDQKEEGMPAEFRTGFAARALDRDNFSLDAFADLASSAQGGTAIHFGSELNLNGTLFLRGGISGRTQGAILGIGLKLEKLYLDWSTQLSPLGSKEFSHVTVGYAF